MRQGQRKEWAMADGRRRIATVLVFVGCCSVSAQTQQQQHEDESCDLIVRRAWGCEADGFVPPNAPVETEAQGKGAVSVTALRQPLSEKGRKLLEQAEAQTRKSDRAAADKTLERALALKDARPLALLMLGTARLNEYLHSGDSKTLDLALTALEEAVPQLPGEANGHSNLALALYSKGEDGKALSEAKKALQLDPGAVKTRYVIGIVLLRQGKTDEAAYHLKMAAPTFAPAADVMRMITGDQVLAQTTTR
jgi:tetratricopeptide (TPR) repeat protein